MKDSSVTFERTAQKRKALSISDQMNVDTSSNEGAEIDDVGVIGMKASPKHQAPTGNTWPAASLPEQLVFPTNIKYTEKNPPDEIFKLKASIL